jgi:hypothetical protein
MTSRLPLLGQRAGGAPRRYYLDDYMRWFPTSGKRFLRYLRRSKVLPVANAQPAGTVAVLVVPWVCTPVPWYSIMLAIGLARRGRRVALIWDDTGFPELHVDRQNQVIGKVLEHVGQFIPVTRLSLLHSAPEAAGDPAIVESLTSQNMTWISRGASSAGQTDGREDQVRASLDRTLPKVRSALDGLDLDCLVVPGGVYGTSGLFRHEAAARGLRVATFDTDRRIGQLSVDGVAAQNSDIPRAFDVLWASGAEVRRQVVDLARDEFQSRIDNRDSYGFQTGPAAGSPGDVHGTVLMPLNVEWDTAALGRHVHFANTVDWLNSTIEFVLDNDDREVIIRQHPSERRRLQRGNLDFRSLLRDRFGHEPRVRFIAADDAVNSYDLLSTSGLVLPYVSTIAMEAAAMGKPVLVSGESYFSGLGFVWAAGSRDEYFTLLQRGLRGHLDPLPDQSERAWVCYYLAAVRNRIPTDFTPHPDDFWDWCQRDPDQVFADPEVVDILTAIDQDEPVSLLRHRRLSAVNAEC